MKNERILASKFIANTLYAVSEAIDADRPTTWPDSSDADRAAYQATNAALDVIIRALNKVADRLQRGLETP